MTEFIYLIPGNWFELKNIIIEKTIPYDEDSFIIELSKQIKSSEENLSVINAHYPIINTNTKNIEFYLSEEKFSTIASILQSEKAHPIITFHGTSLQSAQSIIKNGYNLPGENGVKSINGLAHGKGIYSTPFYQKAMSYAVSNNHSNIIALVVNILFLGKAKMMAQGSINNDCIDTKILYGMDQFVTINPQRIIPLAIIRIENK